MLTTLFCFFYVLGCIPKKWKVEEGLVRQPDWAIRPEIPPGSSRQKYFSENLRPGSLGQKYFTLFHTQWLHVETGFAGNFFFNIILWNLAVRILAIFLLMNSFLFSSWGWIFDRYISIIDRKMSNTNEYFFNRFTSIVLKNYIVRQISIIEIVMVAPQRACRPLRDNVIE